jgi:putative SOS response-associated peptidase YedK
VAETATGVIAPTQLVPAIVAERRLVTVRWGLVPAWAPRPTAIGHTFNARAETAAQKPVFRGAMERRRCLLPVSGYYEWSGPPKVRQPWYITDVSGEELALAGLHEFWRGRPTEGAEPQSVHSCTILTMSAAPDTEHLHHRSPVFIERVDWDRWLDPSVGSEGVRDLLQVPGAGRLTAVAVERLDGTNRLPNPLPEPPAVVVDTLW